MRKWILFFVVVAVIVAVSVIPRFSTKTTYVNGLAQYNQLPGQEYIFERDCYIFKFKNEPSTYPLVGANVPGSAVSVPALPAVVDPANIGKEFPDVRILDVAKTGSRFRIVSVRRDQSRSKTRLTFEILFTNENERRYPRLDAYYILDQTPTQQGKAPEIIQDFAVQRVKK